MYIFCVVKLYRTWCTMTTWRPICDTELCCTLTICCDYVCVCFLELSTLFFLTRYDFVAMKCNVNNVGNILLSTSTFCIIQICECVSLPVLSIFFLKKRKGCFSLNEAYMQYDFQKQQQLLIKCIFEWYWTKIGRKKRFSQSKNIINPIRLVQGVCL